MPPHMVLFRATLTTILLLTLTQIVNALRATSAAPTYFERQGIAEKDYADGGLGANCPAAKGLQLAQYCWNQDTVDKDIDDKDEVANQIFNQSRQMRKTEFVLSLGTGVTKAEKFKRGYFMLIFKIF